MTMHPDIAITPQKVFGSNLSKGYVHTCRFFHSDYGIMTMYPDIAITPQRSSARISAQTSAIMVFLSFNGQ